MECTIVIRSCDPITPIGTMDIAVVSSGHIPSRWAHSLAPAKNAHGFQQLGHRVELLTVERLTETINKRRIPDVHAHYDIDDAVEIRYFRDNPLFYVKEQKPIGYLPGALRRLTGNRIRYLWDPERRISRYCADREFDLVYCRTYRTAYYNVRRGVPTVMESHTQNTEHPDLRKVIDVSDEPAFRGLVTISEALRENFVRAGVPGEKVAVVQPGVDLERFEDGSDQRTLRRRLGLPVDRDIVLYTGSLAANRGIERLIDTAGRLPGVEFVFVGGAEEQREHWASVAASRDVENVRLVEFVPNEEIPRYLAAADVLTIAYEDDGETDLDLDYTSPSKLFEYMAARRPIVAADIPPHARLVSHGESALLVPPDDVTALSDEIRRVLSNDKLGERLAANAYEEAKKYQWKRRCETILDEFAWGR